MGDFDIRFYLSVLWRRLPSLLLITVSAATVAAVIAHALPPVYRANAKIVAEAPQISSDVASSTVPINPWQQMQLVEQRITTRDNLVRLARELNVYEENAAPLSDEIVADDMRNRTSFNQLDMNSPSGSEGATVFNVSFDAREPDLAANVVNAFVTLIVDRSATLRSDRASDATRFFTREVADLGKQLSNVEAEILAFKTTNQEALPESLEFRRTRQGNQQERLAQLNREESALRTRRNNLVQLFQATGRIGSAAPSTPEQQMLSDLNNTLASQLVLFAEDSPNIVALRKRIATLKQDISATDKVASSSTSELDLQLMDIDEQLDAINVEKRSVQDGLGRLTTSIAATPANDTALAALERKRENLKSRYDLAVTRLSAASTGQQIEANAQGGNFSLVEPAISPTSPISPNRVRIFAIGIIGGLMAGAAFIVLMELLNKTVRRPRQLLDLLQTQPLEVVPYIWTEGEAAGNRMSLLFTSIAAVAIIPIAILMVEYVLPLERILLGVMTALGRPPIM